MQKITGKVSDFYKAVRKPFYLALAGIGALSITSCRKEAEVGCSKKQQQENKTHTSKDIATKIFQMSGDNPNIACSQEEDKTIYTFYLKSAMDSNNIFDAKNIDAVSYIDNGSPLITHDDELAYRITINKSGENFAVSDLGLSDYPSILFGPVGKIKASPNSILDSLVNYDEFKNRVMKELNKK